MSNSEKEEVIAGLQKIYDETAYNVTPHKAIRLIEQQSARIAELERENALLKQPAPTPRQRV